MVAGVAASPAKMAAGSPALKRNSRNTMVATIAITGIVASNRCSRNRDKGSGDLLVDVPEHRRRSGQKARDRVAIGKGDGVLPGRYIGHDFVSALLNILGDLLLLDGVGLAREIVAQLFDGRIIDPAEPAGALAAAVDAQVGDRVQHVGSGPGGVKDVPAA